MCPRTRTPYPHPIHNYGTCNFDLGLSDQVKAFASQPIAANLRCLAVSCQHRQVAMFRANAISVRPSARCVTRAVTF
jgi:hypothetical protein